jgi:hypothetical protein
MRQYEAILEHLEDIRICQEREGPSTPKQQETWTDFMPWYLAPWRIIRTLEKFETMNTRKNVRFLNGKKMTIESEKESKMYTRPQSWDYNKNKHS